MWPVLIIRLAGRPLSGRLALLMMGSGVATVLLWGASPYAGAVFKALPGMAVPLLLYLVASLLGGWRLSRHPHPASDQHPG